MDDFVTWLLEQVAEDEREATAAFSGQCDPENGWGISGRAITPHVGVIHEDVQRAHVAKWNPARVLAECEAKRRVIRLYQNAVQAQRAGSISNRNRTQDEAAVDVLGAVVQEFGVMYAQAGRPGYREEWKP